jgi:hypothetical protein
MKYLKCLSLSVVAAAAMGLVGSGVASATEVYRGASTLGPGNSLDFTLKPATTYNIVFTDGKSFNTCTTSTLKSKIASAGSSASTTTAEVTSYTSSFCTVPTTTLTNGKLEFHHIVGTTNATVIADTEISVTFSHILLGSCVYGAKPGMHLGVITGGSPATWHVNNVTVKLSGSPFSCPESTKWTATYVSTEPTGDLHFEAS